MKKGTCKHFNGSVNEKCEAGVCYYDVTPDPGEPGWWIRTPCVAAKSEHAIKTLKEHGPQGTCSERTEPTDEEITEHEAYIEKRTEMMKKSLHTINRIKQEHCGESWSGIVTCPVCYGKLHVSHAAYNGHVHGKCETEDCLAWME